MQMTLTKLKMLQRRDGIPAGALLDVHKTQMGYQLMYKNNRFSNRWIELAIEHRKAKPYFRVSHEGL